VKRLVEEKIKDYLKEQGISQVYLAGKAEIDLPKLNLSLNGKRRLTFDEYERICWALDVGVDKFLSPKMPEEKAG
jgi:transcriptional regulator with XRE-family HTH domain